MKKIYYFSLSAFLLLPVLLGAQNTVNNRTFRIEFPNPVRSASNLYEFIALVLNNVVMPLGGVVAVLYIILAGFHFVTARGNETELAKARGALLGAAIGTAIILGAWAISQAIQATVNQVIAP